MKQFQHFWLKYLVMGVLWALPAPVSAGQATNTAPVALKVTEGCALQTSALMFIAPNALLNVVIDASTTLTVTCSPNTAYSVEIDDGLHAQGNNKRRMANGLGGLVAYNVYLDSQRTKVWGKGQTKNLIGNSGTGSPVLIPVYGRVPIAGLLIAGEYRDTLIVTLNF